VGTPRGKTIDDILNMPVEEGVEFFASEPAIGKKIEVVSELGLGYLTLGHVKQHIVIYGELPSSSQGGK